MFDIKKKKNKKKKQRQKLLANLWGAHNYIYSYSKTFVRCTQKMSQIYQSFPCSQTQAFFTTRTAFANINQMFIEDCYAVLMFANVCEH